MDPTAAGYALAQMAVLASADAGHTGQNIRNALFKLQVGRCQFLDGAWIVHAGADDPPLAPLLDALAAIPAAQRRVAHLFVEQSFVTGTLPDDAHGRARLTAAEAASVAEVRRLLELLAPTLQTLAVVCALADPAAHAGALLRGLRFPVLEHLAVAGPAATAAACALPAAPRLRRLQVPSDMLRVPQAAAAPHAHPRLANLAVSPLRARCTSGQMEALRRYGEHIGVFAVEGGGDGARPEGVLPCVEVEVFSSLEAARAAEVGRLRWDLLGWLRPELPHSCLVFNDTLCDEPPYEEMAVREEERWRVRRREVVLG